MKKAILFLVVSIIPLFSLAAEIGYKGGVYQRYTGGVELFSKGDTSLESSGIPLAVFVKNGPIRLQYTQYTQHASDKHSDNTFDYWADATLRNEVLSAEYIHEVRQFYIGAGAGIFKSVMSFNLGRTDGIWISGDLKSENQFDIGLIGAAGANQKFGNAFIGIECNYIIKEIVYSKNKAGESDSDPVDIGGFMVFVTTGVEF